MTDCRHCKTWRECVHDDSWFSFAEFRFCSLQVFWALKYSWVLKQGSWPAPEGVVPPGIHGQMTAEAKFVKPETVIAEIETRLERTGWRGKLLQEECINREKMMYLSDEAKAALYYISGWKRKGDFREWRKKRRYRQNVHQKVLKAENVPA